MKRKRILKKRWILLIILVLVAAGIAVRSPFESRTTDTSGAYFAAEIRDLKITVSESGTVKPLKQLEIKCEVEGRDTTVLRLIPEGVFITEEDINEEDPTKSLVLVELDSADIRDKITQHEITFQSAEASYTQAKESYDIQLNQNESNITSGELKTKFNRMDLDKYLGAELAEVFVQQPTAFTGLISDERLGGQAMQEYRKLQNSITLANEEVTRADTRLDSTQRLYDKDFVALTELDADKLARTRKVIEQEQALTALDIFLKYEFPKQVEQKLADHHEAIKELERTKARARSEMAKSKAELKNREAAYRIQKERHERLQEQLAACIIRATQPGLVVYGTSGNRWNPRPPLEEGQTVHQHQVLINIPNSSQMTAQIKVHEASINDVELGQKAVITFDAFPDLALNGTVHKKAMLPDPQHRWLNPDLKVYSTDIIIDGESKLLKPGLSATVEILIDELHDVLVVPIQTVVPEGEGQVCYMLNNGRPEKQLVEIGRAGNEFIEIKSGLLAGDQVMLDPPRYGDGTDEEAPDDEEEGEQ
ncbi:MAG: HlyD family efflux transporter periplasmic adaptor subunit, partial [Planctomycetes bacterium]|nr:HlyD family efflux transporter periplasmic adaptor subunit [Planctomycetota bacterium]